MATELNVKWRPDPGIRADMAIDVDPMPPPRAGEVVAVERRRRCRVCGDDEVHGNRAKFRIGLAEDRPTRMAS